MKDSRIYRMMCAPENIQAELIENENSRWDSGLSGNPESSNYYLAFAKVQSIFPGDCYLLSQAKVL